MNSSTMNFTSPVVHPSADITTFIRSALLCCNLLFGLPTNSYVLWLIAGEKRIPSEFFHINLTVCEMIYSMIFFIYVLREFPCLKWISNFLQGLIITGRPLFQSLICVERYLAVVHPVTFLKSKPLRYRLICCVVVWILTLTSCVCCMFILTETSLIAYTWFFSLQFLLFLSIQLFCLTAVLRALKQPGPGERNRERVEENRMKRRALQIILVTTVTLVVMFGPFIFTGFLSVLQKKEQNELSLMWFLSFCTFILAGFVQPVLYLHRAGKLICFCPS